MQLSMFLSAAKQRRCLVNSLFIIAQRKNGVNYFSPNFYKFFELFFKDFLPRRQAPNNFVYIRRDMHFYSAFIAVFVTFSRKICCIATKNALLSEVYSYYTTMKEKMSNNLVNPGTNLLSSTTLDKIPVGSSCKIEKCNLNEPLRTRLQEMGLTPEAAVTVLKTAPLGDPIEIKIRGYSLCIRAETARGFVVVPTKRELS